MGHEDRPLQRLWICRISGPRRGGKGTECYGRRMAWFSCDQVQLGQSKGTTIHGTSTRDDFPDPAHPSFTFRAVRSANPRQFELQLRRVPDPTLADYGLRGQPDTVHDPKRFDSILSDVWLRGRDTPSIRPWLRFCQDGHSRACSQRYLPDQWICHSWSSSQVQRKITPLTNMLILLKHPQWGKDRPAGSGNGDGYVAQRPQPGFNQSSPTGYFPQYAGVQNPMSPMSKLTDYCFFDLADQCWTDQTSTAPFAQSPSGYGQLYPTQSFGRANQFQGAHSAYGGNFQATPYQG